MGTKRRVVVNADAADLRLVEELVASGRYRTVSDFVREAVHEKLVRAEAEVLEDEVARYCAAGYANEDPDLIRRYMAAQVEAIARAKRDRNSAMTVMGKYLRTNDLEMLSETYDIYVQKHLLKVPLPSVDALKTVLEELAARNPKAKEVDPRKFFDDSFVRQMQSSGFIDSLYR